jgi:hypothetical protein
MFYLSWFAHKWHYNKKKIENKKTMYHNEKTFAKIMDDIKEHNNPFIVINS